jgi:hypothetical protein
MRSYEFNGGILIGSCNKHIHTDPFYQGKTWLLPRNDMTPRFWLKMATLGVN